MPFRILTQSYWKFQNTAWDLLRWVAILILHFLLVQSIGCIKQCITSIMWLNSDCVLSVLRREWAHGKKSPQGGKWGGTHYMLTEVCENVAVNRQKKYIFLKNKLRVIFSSQSIKSPELSHQPNETSLPLSAIHIPIPALSLWFYFWQYKQYRNN